FMKWEIAPPPEFTVDRAQMTTDLNGVRTGAEAMPFLQRRLGHNPRHVLETQAKYEVLKLQIAKKYGIPPQKLGSMTIPSDRSAYISGPDEEANPAAPPVTQAEP